MPLTPKEIFESKKQSQEYWATRCKVGMGTLRMKSKEFWNLTMFEFNCIIDSMIPKQTAPCTSLDLEKMMEKFPDKA